MELMPQATRQEIKSTLRRLLPRPVLDLGHSLRARLTDLHYARSYSQEGEDMVLRRIFEGKETGFFVDVGAHHPRRFSNTYFFYRQGWTGINIDAMPDSMLAFQKMRPRDINIEAAIAKEEGRLTFYIFDEPALNTFDSRLAELHQKNSAHRLVTEKQIVTQTLGQIVRQRLPAGQRVDFLSIDVEGMDLEVLESNDWAVCTPDCILTESLGEGLENLTGSRLNDFLSKKGYALCAKTVNTMIFLRSGR